MELDAEQIRRRIRKMNLIYNKLKYGLYFFFPQNIFDSSTIFFLCYELFID
jgi:hypothetical protein